MEKNNFEKLIEEEKTNSFIEIKDNAMYISFENVQKLKDKGFNMDEDTIEALMDYFHDEKFEVALKKYQRGEKIKSVVFKPLTLFFQAIVLILFMLLIYYLTPSFSNRSQDRDDGDMYQMQYR